MGQKSKNVSPMSNSGRKAYATENLTNALLSLLSEKTMNEISIGELIETAGVGRATFYRNFESKEDILQKHTEKITEEFIKKRKFTYNTSRFREYTVMLFEHLEKHKEYCDMLLRNNLLHTVADTFDRYFMKEAKGKDSEYRQMFLSGGFFNIFKYWLMKGCKETPEELADMFLNFM